MPNFFPLVSRLGIREAVARAGVGDEAIVRARRLHLLLERRDLGVGHEAVGCTMADEDLGLDPAGSRPVHRDLAVIPEGGTSSVLGGCAPPRVVSGRVLFSPQLPCYARPGHFANKQ